MSPNVLSKLLARSVRHSVSFLLLDSRRRQVLHASANLVNSSVHLDEEDHTYIVHIIIILCVKALRQRCEQWLYLLLIPVTRNNSYAV